MNQQVLLALIQALPSTPAHLNKILSSCFAFFSGLRPIQFLIIFSSSKFSLIAFLRLCKFPNAVTSGSAFILSGISMFGCSVYLRSTLNHTSSAVVVVLSLNVTIEVCLIYYPYRNLPLRLVLGAAPSDIYAYENQLRPRFFSVDFAFKFTPLHHQI